MGPCRGGAALTAFAPWTALLSRVITVAVPTLVVMVVLSRGIEAGMIAADLLGRRSGRGLSFRQLGKESHTEANAQAGAQAQPGATVLDPSRKARFTVLTDRLLRMEFSLNGTFENRRTVAVIRRRLKVPQHSVSIEGSSLYLRTQHLTLEYTVGQPFSPSTLSVSSREASPAADLPEAWEVQEGASRQKVLHWKWHPGLPTTGNLMGTYSSLDEIGQDRKPPYKHVPLNCTDIARRNLRVHDEELHCSFGVVSRGGWALVNETGSPTLDASGWWTGEVVSSDEDLYLFGHGHDYKAALRDFTAVAGRVPILPRYMLGIMWSRWYNFDVRGLHSTVDTFESHMLPLDVLILDMNFHQKPGWTGYSFDRALFPHPAHDMAGLKERGLALSVNTHDRDGIGPEEDMYGEVVRRIGGDPTLGARVPFSICNSSQVTYAIEDTVIKHLMEQGVDFTWIDYQQGGSQGGCSGGQQNPRIWLNHVRSLAHNRRGEPERGAVLARWGGLGSHRYPVGFSGDVAGIDNWENLAFQQYFSMTAANVGYSWSHDIVGPAASPEITVRWVQAGAYSSSFRIHDRGLSAGPCAADFPPLLQNGCGVVNMWELRTPFFEPVREAMQERAAMVPYLYTAMYRTWETGLQAMLPMYYEWPESQKSYEASSYDGCQQRGLCQFMLGPDMLVAPVLRPVSEDTNLAEQRVWLPQGVWVEKHSLAVFQVDEPNGQEVCLSYDLSEVPVFVKGGAVVPTTPMAMGRSRGASVIGAARQMYSTLALTIYPGAETGSGEVYEDDGMTQAYMAGEVRWTMLTYSRDTRGMDVLIETVPPLEAHNRTAFPAHRTFIIEVLGDFPAEGVTVNGQAVVQKPTPRGLALLDREKFSWHYYGPSTTMRIVLIDMLVSLEAPIRLRIWGDMRDGSGQLRGIRGLLYRRASLAKSALDIVRKTPGSDQERGGSALLSILSSYGSHLTFLAMHDLKGFRRAVRELPGLFHSARAELEEITGTDPRRLAYTKALLDTANVAFHESNSCAGEKASRDLLRQGTEPSL